MVDSSSGERFVALFVTTVLLVSALSTGATLFAGTAAAAPDTTPPTADAGTGQTIYAGSWATLDASASSDNSVIQNYAWDFDGDGTTDLTTTDALVTHTYWSVGTHTAELTVTDGSGNSDTDTVSITVKQANAKYMGGPGNLGWYPNQSGPTSKPVEAWNISDSTPQVMQPTIVNGTLYTAFHDGGRLYALDPQTGAEFWNATPGGSSGSTWTTPAYANGVLYIGSNDYKLHAIDASDGHELWNVSRYTNVRSAPAVVDGVVYFGSNDGNMTAVNATTGKELWHYTEYQPVLVESNPAVVDGVVYFASDADNVTALNATTGNKIWNFSLPDESQSDPTVVNDTVYVGSDSWLGETSGTGTVWALNATDGTERWHYNMSGDVDGGQVYADGIVYAGSRGGNLTALDAADGSVVWNVTGSGFRGAPVVAGGVVYISDFGNDTVHAFNATDGTELWWYKSPTGNLYPTPLAWNGYLYYGSYPTFYALKEPVPTISNVAATNPSGQDVQVSFDSDTQLQTISVSIVGVENATLTTGDFAETGSAGSYTYTATYAGSSEGTYTATVDTAADAFGNDGASGQSASVTVDTIPPTISAFSVSNPTAQDVQVSFNSNETLDAISLSIGGAESSSLDRTNFTEIGSGPYTYTATYHGTSNGSYTATLDSARDAAGNEGANTESASVPVGTAVVSSDVRYVSGTRPDMSNVTIDARFSGGLLQVQAINATANRSDRSTEADYELGGLGADGTTVLRTNVSVQNFTPRALIGSAHDVNWTRTNNGDGTWNVSIEGTPAAVESYFDSNGSSPTTWPGTIRANESQDAALTFAVDDLDQLSSTYRERLNGSIMSTDAQEFGTLQYNTSGANDRIELHVEGPHVSTDGSNNTGFFEAFLPQRLLDDWGVSANQLVGRFDGTQRSTTIRSVSGGARVAFDVHYSEGDAVVAVDTTPPTISDFSVANSDGRNVTVRFNATESLAGLNVTVGNATSKTLTRGDFTETVSGGTYTYAATVNGSADGTYDVRLNEATDTAGNDGASGETDSVTVDTTAPSISYFSATNPSGQDVRIRVNASESLAALNVTIGNATSKPLTRGDFTETVSGDTHTYTATVNEGIDGTYDVRLDEATDAAGNDGATGQTASVTVDTTPPTISDFSAANPDGRNVTVSFNATGSLAGLNVTVDNATSKTLTKGDFTETVSAGNYTYTATVNGSADGTYDVRLNEATDAFGNDGASGQSASVTVDATTPTADAGTDRTIFFGGRVSFDAGASTDSVGIARYDWDFDDGTNASGATVNHTYSAPGRYTVTLTVTDGHGNDATDTLTVTVEDAYAQFGYDAGHTNAVPDRSGPTSPVETAWAVSTGGEVRSTPVIVDGTVYISGTNGTVYAIDEATGRELWNASVPPADGGVAVANGVVYAVAADGVWALDAYDGIERWNTSTGGSISDVQPTVVDGTVYVGNDGGYVYALDTGDGSEHWSFDTGGANLSSTPTVVDGIVYVGSGTGNRVFALDAQTGTKRWSHATSGAVYGTPTVVGSTVYVASDDGAVFALDTADGSERWNATSGSGFERGVLSSRGGLLYVADASGNVTALRASDGSERWNATTGGAIRSGTVAAADVVYTASDGEVYALNATTGAALWTASAGADAIEATPTVWNDRVFVPSSDGTLYALEHHRRTTPDTGGSSGGNGDSGGNSPAPTAHISFVDSHEVAVGDPISMTADYSANGTTASSYAWSFGDGATATGKSVSHAYDGPGTYSVSLSITDSDGTTVSTDATVTVTAYRVDVSRSANETNTSTIRVKNAAAGMTVNVTNDVRTGGNDSIADESNITLSNVAVTVEKGGSFELNVSVEEHRGDREFTDATGSESVGRVTVDHTISDDDIGGVQFTFGVRKSYLEGTGVDPAHVRLFRFHAGEYTTLKTSVVGETADYYVFSAESPGLSVFTIGADPADISVTDASLSGEPAVPGDSVTVSATVTNDGGMSGTASIVFSADGEERQTRTVTVDPGETVTVTADLSLDTGVHDVSVNDVNAGTVTVSDQSAGTTSTTTTAQPDDQSGGNVPWLWVLVALVALVAVGLLFRRSTE